ncbi:ABC transporter ATP-binding protein [Enterococcus raffinosus]|uniref:ABC transporter ATP-binding protein n=1 Tax=Enterococcus raffinosus TaxID=71452 RepID=A0AAW8T2L5_9ENTE|nr:ABC transporter ATP-binding protein [Enterococcus raffinosus]MDT2525278.1 ABC transporter ATP-binding protein [Enterococcus raffinosus]MDT2528492.1 ABC transporter ATP-binding protein [Enterococcus raffinosus]MDT2535811.1 ABC transporter ATP-binding protein [Enterococcus raffinosus]MDT2543481.1 ABC transporter ATP-binding protein [Enterococcus raffinosus]MDT2553595.1 ABC transporter ATP-binding protein [Enterococcus raffinosus]
MEKIINVQHLSKSYGTRNNKVTVLNDLNFTVEKGEFVGIMGPSGAGKTTLMNILSTILLPTMGSVKIAGADITQMRESRLTDFRREKLGFIFQDFNLIDSLTVKDNIILPLTVSKLSNNEIEERVLRLAGILRIEQILARYPEEISVGQQQRTAAARALISKPLVLFADEPTGSLDSKSATEFLNYLDDVNLHEETTILMVTHDPYTASYCNRVLFIKDGRFFAEIVRRSSRKDFFEKVIDMQATIGGGGKANAD